MIRAKVRERERERERERQREKKMNGANRTWSLGVGGQAKRSTRSIRLLDRGSMLAVELSTGSVDSLNDQDSGRG